MSVLMEFSIFPTDQGESVSDHVSEVIRMIKESGVDYRLTPMGTVIETERDDNERPACASPPTPPWLVLPFVRNAH